MLTKYRKNVSPWGRVHLKPHPAMAIEMAHVLADTVLYSVIACRIGSLTLGPREGRHALLGTITSKSFRIDRG